MVKLDFINAFNSLHRSDILSTVASVLPELYANCYSAYASFSYLFHGPYTIMSQEGFQQGGPLGPLLFSSTIQPLLESLASPLTLGFFDDLTVVGSQKSVADDIDAIINVGSKMGLHLNVSKCEVIAHADTIIADQRLSDFQRIDISEALLLGAPLFRGFTLDEAWAKRCNELRVAVDRLSLLAAQDALVPLRSSFSAPRVQHLLR